MNALLSARAALARLAALVVLTTALTLALAGPPISRAATPTTQLNAAGLVIRHGDGKALYFYVQFSEPVVAATDLLQRSGVTIDITPFGGLGQAICRIDGEGCPSSNCWCKSYSNPSFYWRYEKLQPSGSWVALPYAASQKAVHDGDVVGFSWSSEDGDLPRVTLDQIARLNGIATIATPAAPEATTAAQTVAPAPPTDAPAETTQALAATVSPIVRGVAVGPSGTATAVRAPAAKHLGVGNYVWYGASAVAILLVGAVVVFRRRGMGP